MGSIGEKRSDGKYRARYRDSNGKEHARHFKTQADAKRWLRVQEGDVDDGAHVDPKLGRVKFGVWSERWLAMADLKPKTRAGYESILRRHLLPRWENIALSSIDSRAVKAWKADLVAGGMSPGTVKNVVNAMKAAMTAAVEDGVVKVNPCVGVKLPEREHIDMCFLTAEQVLALADAVGPEQSTLVLFAAYGGMRAGEIAALDWARVNFLGGSVDVVASYAEVHGALLLGTTKTGRTRTVRLPRFLMDLLGEHQTVTGPKGLVFRDSRGGALRHSNFYRRTFKPAVARAAARDPEFPAGLRFHDLRHTAAALMVGQGAHPLAIKERLGHSSITVTLDTYGRLFPSVDEALAEGLDGAYREAVSTRLRTNRGLEPVTELPATGS